MVYRNYLLVCILLALANSVEKVLGQTANCFSTATFACSGIPDAQRFGLTAGQQCCDDGFLAFIIESDEVCSICTSNSICHASSNCSDVFPGLGTQTPGSCCGTGSAYIIEPNGTCQACPSSVGGCYTELDCAGVTVPLSSIGAAAQVRECCLSEKGQSYDLLGQCGNCIVYGFLKTRIVGSERGQGYPIQIGYLKGTGGVIRGRIEEVPGGNAVMGADYSLSSIVATGRPGNPDEIIATFRVDNIAQEANETAQLRFVVSVGNFPAGAIFQDTIDFVIEDSDVVMFQLTENSYRSNELDKRIPVVISKNARLANPVTFLLTPFNESEAIRTGQPLPANIPLDDNPLSPNRAKSYPPDREDFSSNVIVVTFQADEFGTQINDVPAPVVIIDDEINEALEEVFIVVLTLENSTNPDGVVISRESSPCGIIDNDDIVIGFQNASYTFLEPEFEQEVFGIVFLEKENGRISEQEFLVLIEVNTATPNTNIRPANLSSLDAGGNFINNDYLLVNPDQTVILTSFLPTEQTLEFVFTLFPDDTAEGTEAFQARSSLRIERFDVPYYTFPTNVSTVFAETFIIIEDDDFVILGFEQNFTVAESVGSFEACFRVFNPPDDQELIVFIELVVNTIEGTAGNLDFTPIRSRNLETLHQNKRRACFSVSIILDQDIENSETFSLQLSFNESVPDSVRSIVTIEPNVVYVTIEDTNNVVIGFTQAFYDVTEGVDREALLVVRVRQGSLNRSVIVRISTQHESASDGLDYTGQVSTLTFSENVHSIPFPITILDDNINELMETFNVHLQSDNNDIIFAPNRTVVRISDDDGRANCFSTATFACSGIPDAQRFGLTAGQQCCDDGFLAFIIAGENICTTCPNNSICHASSDCSDIFPGLGTLTPGSCCGTRGGTAYVESNGTCEACPSSIDGCFAGGDCGGDFVPPSSTGDAVQVRDCCLSEDGKSYSVLGQCENCIVYGFLKTSIVGSERAKGYPIEIGYSKGTGNVFRGRIEEVPGGSAVMGADYTLSSSIFTGRPGNPDKIIATFRVDRIAQEANETAHLRLIKTAGNLPLGAIFQDTIQLRIEDSNVVVFQLTVIEYRSNEHKNQTPVVVSKNTRLANPVTFLLTPFNVSEAERTGQPLPENIPPNDKPLSSNRAKSYPPEREDFSSDVLTVTFQADEFGTQINDVPSPVVIFDDEINEAPEEVFIVVLTLEDSTNPDGVAITRNTSLCVIMDNDGIVIGFQNASYTFPEPESEQPVFGVVFLEKENGRISEQEFRVTIEVSTVTPNTNIRPATLKSLDADGNVVNNDYAPRFLNPNQTLKIPSLSFLPGIQTLEFDFTLFPDNVAEGTEAFQVRSSPSQGVNSPGFSIPTDQNTHSETFIIIEDDDPVILGFEQNFTVPENVGSFQVCFQVFNPPSDQSLTIQIDLVIDTIQGTAGNLDFTPIRSRNLDVFETLNQNNRRPCFSVSINNDQAFEDTETFSLQLSFDVFIDDAVRNIVVIEPSVVYVTIEDTSDFIIGFVDLLYTGNEVDPSIQFQVGVIGFTTLEREVVIQFNTADGTEEGSAAIADSDYTAVSFLLTLNSTTTRVPVNVSLITDNMFELTESFSGALSLSGGPIDRLTLAPNSAVAEIDDDDVLSVGYNPDSYSFGEDSGPGQISAELSGDPGVFTVFVSYQTDDGSAVGSADYGFANGTLSFNSSQRSNVYSVNIFPDDLREQQLESFGVSLFNISIALIGVTRTLSAQEAGRLSLKPASAQINIVDGDTVTIGFIQTDYEVAENGGPVQFLIGVLEGILTIPVEVSFAIEDGTAVASFDYNQTTATLTISGTQLLVSVFVSLVDDGVYEGLEYFKGILSEGANFPDNVTLRPALANATITDNDLVFVGFETNVYDVSGADETVTFTVSVLNGSITEGASVLVNFFTSQGSALADIDYTETTVNLTFTTINTSFQISVDIKHDQIFENFEFFTGNLQIAPGVEQVVLSPEVATVNITDEDELKIGFNPINYSVIEGNTTVDITVVVIEGSLGRNVEIAFNTVDILGQATGGKDYAILNQTLTFSSDNNTISIPVMILDDSAVESEFKSFSAILTDPAIDHLTVSPAIALVTIQDNDTASIGFDRLEYEAIEDAQFANVTIRLSGMISKDIVVHFSTADGSAISGGSEPDFVSHSMGCTFSPGGPSEITIPTRIIDDVYLEDDENLSSMISLSAFTNVIQLDPAESTINIIDNDHVVVGFTQPLYEVTEGVDSVAPLVVSVLNGSLRRSVVVNAVTQEETAVDGSDYPGQVSTLTFSENILSIPFPIIIVDDNISELVETFIGSLQSGDSDVILTPNRTVIRIIDDASKCPALPIPENGTISYAPDSIADYDVGTVATYLCSTGFSLEGNRTRTCIILGNVSEWDRNDESRICTPLPSSVGLVVGITVGAVAIALLLILIIVTLSTIVLLRRKLNRRRQLVLHVDEDPIYEDPDAIPNNRPPLPSRNIRVNDNQAYEKAFEMDENRAYTTGQAPGVNESELQRLSSENNRDEYEIRDLGSGVERCSSGDNIRVIANLAYISGQAPESSNDIEMGPDVNESCTQSRSSEDDQESGMQESSSEDRREEGNPNDTTNRISDSVNIPGDEHDTQNEYLTIIP